MDVCLQTDIRISKFIEKKNRDKQASDVESSLLFGFALSEVGDTKSQAALFILVLLHLLWPELPSSIVA